MIERIYILESVDPVIFYGVNNSNMQLIKTLFPKLRIVARGNVMKVIGDEDESELFLKKIREVEKYCEEYNSLSEDIILDIVKGKAPVVAKQENLIIHGMNGKPIVARTENQRRLVKTFEENDRGQSIEEQGNQKNHSEPPGGRSGGKTGIPARRDERQVRPLSATAL